MRLRTVSVAVTVLLLVLLAYTAWWVSAARQLRHGVEDWAAQQRAAGTSVEYGGLTVAGWPLELAASADRIHLQRPDGLRLDLAALRVAADPWNPLALRIRVPQGLRAVLPGPAGPAWDATGTPTGPTLTAGSGEGTLELGRDGRVQAGSLALSTAALAVRSPTPGTLAADAITLGWRQPAAPPPGSTDPSLSVRLGLTGLVLPNPMPAPLASRIDRLGLEATLRGPLPPDLAAMSLRDWSKAGGVVDLTSLSLSWSGLTLQGDATLALDRDLQPLLAGSARLGGTDVLVDALAGAGLLRPNQAVGVKAALGLLAQPQPDGSRAVQVPVTIQARQLAIGPAKLGEIPEIRWP